MESKELLSCPMSPNEFTLPLGVAISIESGAGEAAGSRRCRTMVGPSKFVDGTFRWPCNANCRPPHSIDRLNPTQEEHHMAKSEGRALCFDWLLNPYSDIQRFQGLQEKNIPHFLLR